MIEYVLFFCWLVALMLSLSRDNWLYNFMGVFMVFYSTGMLYADYPDVFGHIFFVMLSVVVGIVGTYNIFRKFW